MTPSGFPVSKQGAFPPENSKAGSFSKKNSTVSTKPTVFSRVKCAVRFFGAMCLLFCFFFVGRVLDSET